MEQAQNLPECWQELNDALVAGIDRVILFGPPGTGKTYAGMNLGDITGGAWRLICTDDMTNAQVEGHYKPSANGEWKWNDGNPNAGDTNDGNDTNAGSQGDKTDYLRAKLHIESRGID